MMLSGKDCSPFEPQPDAVESAWLAKIARECQVGAQVITLGRRRDEDEPLVYCERDGRWWCGRYIGSVTLEGRRLTIRPRFGLDALRKWLTKVNNLLLVETSGHIRSDELFIAELLARIWGGGLVEAARHGLPMLRRERSSSSRIVRGRLDVNATIASRALIQRRVVSVVSERNLDNPVARTIAVAYGVLRRWLGNERQDRWLSPRAQELIAHVLAAVGNWPELPDEQELSRVRYTPITAPYRRFVQLSLRIARQRGLMADASEDGKARGVLLDVAELWEMYVLSVLRSAAHPQSVKHGTLDVSSRRCLLQSTVDGSRLAELRPDAMIEDGGLLTAICDAKYKRLWPNSWTQIPSAEDLYQLTTYLTRFGAERDLWGALIYPEDPAREGLPPVEQRSPWRVGEKHRVSMLTLPHEPGLAVEKMRAVLTADLTRTATDNS